MNAGDMLVFFHLFYDTELVCILYEVYYLHLNMITQPKLL